MLQDEEEWLAGFEFILQEIMRLRTNPPEGEDKYDWLHMVPHASGRGGMVCGRRATQRFYDIAQSALDQSPHRGRLDVDDVVGALKRVMTETLSAEPTGLDAARARTIVEAALAETARSARTERHFFPCHLTDEGPEAFSIGPVTFERTASVLARTRDRLEARAEAEAAPGVASAKMRRMDADGIQADYGQFGWTAVVSIGRFDRKTGRQRAEATAQAALDFLHVYFGARDSDRMRLGGPTLGVDHRHHLIEGENGELDVSWSRSWPGNGQDKAWFKDFQGRSAGRVADMAVALEALLDPERSAPLAYRYIDALTWYGDGARDRSPAAALLKYVAAIERTVLSGASRAREDRAKVKESGGVSGRVKDRVAAISFIPELNNYWSVRAEVHEIYQMRSDIVHGARSPFDPEVARAAAKAARIASDLLLFWLDRFGDRLHVDQLDPAKVEATYAMLVEQVEALGGPRPVFAR